MVHHPRRIVTIDHDVDVPHGLSAPPPAARPLHPPHGRAVPHPGEQWPYDRIGLRPQQPVVLGALGEADVLQDRSLRLGAEALHLANPPVPAGLLQGVERVDAQLAHEGLHLLGTQPRHPHELEDDGWNLPLQFVEQRQAAGVEQRADLGGEVCAHALDVGERAGRISPHGGQRLHHRTDGAGRVAVGPHAKDVASLILDQVGDVVEDGGDVGIGHGGECTVAARSKRRRRHSGRRGCPCPIAGRSLRTSGASLTRSCRRSGIHASAGQLRRLLWHGQPLSKSAFLGTRLLRTAHRPACLTRRDYCWARSGRAAVG